MRNKRLKAMLLCTATVVSMFASAGAANETVAKPQTLVESAQQAAEAVTAISGAQSVQYAVYQNGKITLSGAAGSFDRTGESKPTDQALYGIGSISKMYTTAAVMQLVQEGKVNLDQPVTTYIPEFKMADERYKQITVRMLLNHSSGLMGDSVSNSVVFEDWNYTSKDFILEKLATSRLKSAPGAFGVYCNDGFTLAEIVVEKASGMSFENYVQTKILTPAGLQDTYFPSESLDTARLAKVYANDEDLKPLAPEHLTIVGAGGLYANASDVAKFGALFFEGNSILSDASIRAMAEKEYAKGVWPANSTHDMLAYGLGWDTVHMYPFVQSNVIALSKGGDTLRCHASLIIIPEHKMAVAVLSAGGVSAFNQLAGARILIDALAEKGVVITETGTLPEAQKAIMPKEIAEFAGVYASNAAISTVAFTEKGTVTVTSPAVLGGMSEELEYYNDGTFREADKGYLLKFVKESNGIVYMYQMGYGNIEGLTSTGTANYTMQRLPANDVSEEVAKVWEARGTNVYFMVNERYSSQVYLNNPMMAITYVEETPGYAFGSAKIIDENNAQYILEIPGSGSRSGNDVKLFVEDDKEYLQAGAYLYMNSKNIPAIYVGRNSRCTIQADGYARWYQVGDAQGKTLTVTLPKKASFHVYDAMGQVVSSSKAWGDTVVTLPEGGWIVFAGQVGAAFEIALETTLSAAA